MSYDLLVYLTRARMPTPAAWQDAIAAANFPVLIDQDFDPDTFTGFLPCKYKGTISGFEYYPAGLSVDDAKNLDVSGADFSATFIAHEGHNEMQTALCAASALCVSSNGVLVDPQSGKNYPASDAVTWAADTIQQCPEDPSDA